MEILFVGIVTFVTSYTALNYLSYEKAIANG